MKISFITIILFLGISIRSYSNEFAIIRTTIKANWGWGEEQVISGDSVKKLEVLSENLKDSWDKVGMIIPNAVVTIYSYSNNRFQLKKTYYYYDQKAVDQLGVKSDSRKLDKFILGHIGKIKSQPSPYEEIPEPLDGK